MMNKLQCRLIIFWVCTGVFLAFCFSMCAYEPKMARFILFAAVCFASLFERMFMKEVSVVAPPIREYFSDKPNWKRYIYGYAFFLAFCAIWLLLDTNGLARSISNHSPMLAFVPIFVPLALPLLAHQIAVFKALGDVDD